MANTVRGHFWVPPALSPLLARCCVLLPSCPSLSRDGAVQVELDLARWAEPRRALWALCWRACAGDGVLMRASLPRGVSGGVSAGAESSCPLYRCWGCSGAHPQPAGAAGSLQFPPVWACHLMKSVLEIGNSFPLCCKGLVFVRAVWLVWCCCFLVVFFSQVPVAVAWSVLAGSPMWSLNWGAVFADGRHERVRLLNKPVLELSRCAEGAQALSALRGLSLGSAAGIAVPRRLCRAVPAEPGPCSPLTLLCGAADPAQPAQARRAGLGSLCWSWLAEVLPSTAEWLRSSLFSYYKQINRNTRFSPKQV